MPRRRTLMPDSCPCCPHYNPFHGACRHPLHRDLVREFAEHGGDCSIYDDVRAAAMRDLEERLG